MLRTVVLWFFWAFGRFGPAAGLRLFAWRVVRVIVERNCGCGCETGKWWTIVITPNKQYWPSFNLSFLWLATARPENIDSQI